MATISFSYSYSISDNINHQSSLLIICGHVDLYATCDEALKSVGITNTVTIETIKNVASSKLNPGQDDGSTFDLFLDDRKIILAVLPIGSSRHNSPARPHAVSSIVKSNKGSGDLTVLLIPSNPGHILAQALAVSRQFPVFSLKSKIPVVVAVNVVIHCDQSPDNEELLKDIEAEADSIRLTQRLVDTPTNILNVSTYVEEVKVIASSLGCGLDIIQGKDLETKGFGGIWGVGKAASHLPALVILSHVPSGSDDNKSVCLVGKGIVYDTGGLSLKIPPGMAGMKVDMAGSAAVLGAFAALVKRNVNQRLHAFLCLAENSVSSDATRPDDVHTFLSGKTAEINNTDAEGRLVLADGCYYATSSFNPSHLIDIATLTGAQGIATGKHHAAIFCNDDSFELLAMSAGKYTGDLTFPIVYCPEFHRHEYKSQVSLLCIVSHCMRNYFLFPIGC